MTALKMTDFVISDLHFGHENILGYCRPQFKNIDEMDATLIENWNAVVGPQDRTIIVGDVTISKGSKGLQNLDRLNGQKILIMGNHDHEHVNTYLPHFIDVKGIGQIWLPAEKKEGRKRAVITHIPIHPQCMRWHVNIHGHMHTENIVTTWFGKDKRYVNVSCEQLNYTPVRLSELLEGYY